MAVHYEDYPVTVYSLAAAKPKLNRADPNSRTGCKFAPLAAGSKSPLTRNFACQNVTISRFAEKLRDLATDYIDHPVVDSTGLGGGWNFVLRRLTLFEALDKELGLKLDIRSGRPRKIDSSLKRHARHAKLEF